METMAEDHEEDNETAEDEKKKGSGLDETN
jgi:hypothetical protein